MAPTPGNSSTERRIGSMPDPTHCPLCQPHRQSQARIKDAPGFMSLRIGSMAVSRNARVGDRMQLHGMSPLWRAVGLWLRGRRRPRLGCNQGIRPRRVARVSFLPRVRLCRLLARIGAEQGRPPPIGGKSAIDGARTHSSSPDRSFRWIGQMGRSATGRPMYSRPLVLVVPLRAVRPTPSLNAAIAHAGRRLPRFAGHSQGVP